MSQLYFQTRDSYLMYKNVCKSSRPNGKIRVPKPWLPPPMGWLKANIDGAFDHDSQTGGIGVVLRNSMGEVVGGLYMCSFVEFVVSPEVVEFTAGREACLLAVNYNLAPLVIESDCITLVQATNMVGVLGNIPHPLEGCLMIFLFSWNHFQVLLSLMSMENRIWQLISLPNLHCVLSSIYHGVVLSLLTFAALLRLIVTFDFFE